MQEAPRDLQAALHPARERHHEARSPLPQPDHLHHLAHALGHGAARHPVQLGVQAQVLLGRQIPVERRVLEHQPDVAPHLVAFTLDIVASHAGGAAGRVHERAEHADRRRLARPVGAEEAERLAGRDREVDAAHRFDLAVALDETVHRHGGDDRAVRGAAGWRAAV